MATLSIKKINKLLDMALEIPPYQHPCKWSNKNIGELLEDIKEALLNQKKFSVSYTYESDTLPDSAEY